MRYVALGLVLVMACGSQNPKPATPVAPVASSAPSQGGAARDGGWMMDGAPATREAFEARLAELNVATKPTYGATIANPDGSYGGTEEHYTATHKQTGAPYSYVVVYATDGRKYHTLTQDAAAPKPATPKPTAAATRFESFVLNGDEVDKATFEAKLATLKVDAEPWVNAHMTNSNGESGGSATYEAVDRRTGQRWTYKVESIGQHAERRLSPGSRKDKDGAIQ